MTTTSHINPNISCISFKQEPMKNLQTLKGQGPGIKPATFMLWCERANPWWTIWNSQLQVPTPKVKPTTTQTAISRQGTRAMFQGGPDCRSIAAILTDIYSKTGIKYKLWYENYILSYEILVRYIILLIIFVVYHLYCLLFHFWSIKTNVK